uniref:flagellar protein n=1 Tax=Agathobacter sp. TaxID=2021311 RepID=UPI004056AF8A
MEVINCRSCGRLFNELGMNSRRRLCPQCVRKLEEKFTQVKEFLRNNPNSTIEVVSQENDVSVKQIKQWVREERLTFSKDSAGGIACEQCGKMIHTGRFCDECKFKIGNNLMSAIDKPIMEMPKKRTHDGDRMRFLQNQNEK